VVFSPPFDAMQTIHGAQIVPQEVHNKTEYFSMRNQVDPYAPDVTPSQMQKLSVEDKKKVAAFSQRLKKLSPEAYGECM
jgi:hypothetical protein